MKTHTFTPTSAPVALVISTSVLVNGKPLTFQGFRSLLSSEKSKQNSAFEASMLLAKACHTGREYYDAHKGTDLLKQYKISNLNEFWLKCGFSKSQIDSNYCKQLAKVGSATPEQVATYKDTARKEGAQISVKGLYTWLNKVKKAVDEGSSQEEAEAEATVGVSKTAEQKQKSPFVMSVDLSFFGLGDTHAKIHVLPTGEMDTNITPEAFMQLATLISEAMKAA